MTKVRRLIFPLSVFVLVWLVHYCYLALFPEVIPAQSQWVAVDDFELTAWQRYVQSQSYFLSYNYAISFGFAAVIFRRYREMKSCANSGVTFGSLGLSGTLSVGSCFLLGCCGSPMLGIYLSLFGSGFLPFAKPMIAAITTAILLGAWFWILRTKKLTCDESIEECRT